MLCQGDIEIQDNVVETNEDRKCCSWQILSQEASATKVWRLCNYAFFTMNRFQKLKQHRSDQERFFRNMRVHCSGWKCHKLQNLRMSMFGNVTPALAIFKSVCFYVAASRRRKGVLDHSSLKTFSITWSSLKMLELCICSSKCVGGSLKLVGSSRTPIRSLEFVEFRNVVKLVKNTGYAWCIMSNPNWWTILPTIWGEPAAAL